MPPTPGRRPNRRGPVIVVFLVVALLVVAVLLASEVSEAPLTGVGARASVTVPSSPLASAPSLPSVSTSPLRSRSFAGYVVRTDPESAITLAAARPPNPRPYQTPEQITSVHARWVHPQIECDWQRQLGFSIWIGVDDGNGDLIAVGSSTTCEGGLTSSYLWYRDRSGAYTQIDTFVGAAKLEALLTITSRGWQIDVTAPSLFDPWTTEVPYALPATTAIWAAGIAMSSERRYSLASFGVVPFSDADATSLSNDRPTALGDASWPGLDRFDLSDDQKPAAEASSLSDGGHAFSIYWRHDAAAPPPPTPVPTPSPVPTPLPVAVVGDVNSPGKSGFSAAVPEGAEVTSVSARWTQPSIVCGEAGGGLFTWVAIGDPSAGSLAIGTASVCDAGGPRSYAWSTVNGWQINELGPVNSGESVTGSVAHVDGTWHVSVARSGGRDGYDSAVDFRYAQVYASWMAATEPMGGTSAHLLPKFTSTTFEDCSATVIGLQPTETSLGILGPGWATITHFQLVDRDGQTEVGSSTPTRGGPSAFDVSWMPK